MALLDLPAKTTYETINAWRLVDNSIASVSKSF
jgi:hypothetical protein